MNAPPISPALIRYLRETAFPIKEPKAGDGVEYVWKRIGIAEVLDHLEALAKKQGRET